MKNEVLADTRFHGVSDALRGEIAYALTKRLVIDMPTAHAAVDEAIKSITPMSHTPSLKQMDAPRSALVDVAAVESEPVTDPEPIAWYMYLWNEADEDIKSDVRWGRPTGDEIARAEHNGHDIEHLYAHPPRSLSNEGLNVEDLTRPIIGIKNRTAHEVFDIMADRIRLALSTRKGSAGDGSASGTTGAAAIRNMGGEG
ncbi:hypothetical protein [Shinella sp. M31]|uniref:hypothetical protein n=1 Tax=Shinella sp. M31 TaxID=3368615 RepID=UPI003BA357FE